MNSNVMFELGMRLAFDKPTIIIKDYTIKHSFDTSIIEHLEYPRDLRFSKIVDFKATIAKKVLATYKHFIDRPDDSMFLGNFGEFKVAELNEQPASPEAMSYEIL